MPIAIDPRYKKLYARTLKSGIEHYLIFDRCSNVLLEHGADELFDNCLQAAIRQSGVAVLSLKYTGNHRDALGLFIQMGFPQKPWLRTFIALLVDFSVWSVEKSNERPNFLPIVEALLELGVSRDDVTELTIEAMPVPGQARQSENAPTKTSKTKEQEQTQSHRPRIFIGSSSEGLEVAEAIHTNLDHDYECTVWNQGVFGLSSAVLESLENQVQSTDFAILVVTPDDTVESRGERATSPRDNIIFELGLFMGSLGRTRTFIVRPRKSAPKMPTDLAGITVATYDAERSDKNFCAAVTPACAEIKRAIRTATSAGAG